MAAKLQIAKYQVLECTRKPKTLLPSQMLTHSMGLPPPQGSRDPVV